MVSESRSCLSTQSSVSRRVRGLIFFLEQAVLIPKLLFSRTFPLVANGWPSKEVAEIYAIVEEMQERCIAMLGPGVRYLDAFHLADRIAVNGLMRLGILRKADVEELLRSGISRAFFPHGLGHHMGLDVHDVSADSILSICRDEERPMNRQGEKVLLRSTNDFMAPCTSDAALLEPGMVITVEPGLCMFVNGSSNGEKLIWNCRFLSLRAGNSVASRPRNLEIY